MAAPGAQPPDPPVDAYLSRLRRRAALVHAVRASLLALGAASLVFATGAMVVGPLGDASGALLAWAMVAIALGAVSVWAWRAFGPLRGAGVARLLGDADPTLPSAARTAWELTRGPMDGSSEPLIRAHEARVRAVLAQHPPRQIVRWRRLRHRTVALGLIGAALAFALLASERGRAGAYSLIHPGERDALGDRVVVAFGDVEAHIVYPGYLDRPSVTVVDPSLLEVPRGTSIEIRATPQLAATEAALRIGGRLTPMERSESGGWFGRFVAREDGPIALRLRRPEGDWVRDATSRDVRVIADEAPRVSLIDPADDLVLDGPEEVAVTWMVIDDVGVASVDLVVRDPRGEERRRRVASFDPGEQPRDQTSSAPLDLALLGAQPGDAVTVWVEARDGDVVSGPNLGRSAELTIHIASEASRRSERLAGLEALLDRGLHLLADHLERPVPEVEAASKERFEALRPPTDGFIAALREHADALRGEEGVRASDVSVFTSMAGRVRRLLQAERVANGRRVAPLAEREAVDGRMVSELEDDVLSLDDLVGRARVEDAAEIARELEQIRREIRSLLSELRRTDSPEARQQLLAAIARAQARMQALMQRMAEMGTSVPQEFMNAGGEMPTQESANALAELSEAIQRGDLEGAERLVDQLERQIDQIARALGQTEQSFVEARFGPRERAMANAMDSLAGLETEQQQLAGRGTERRGRAAHRALEAIGGRDNRVGRQLAQEAGSVREALENVDRDRLAGFEQDAYDRARQRLIDTQDALSAGDLGEARRMSEAAAQDLSSLSRDLDLSALMFPGREGETREDAREARNADRNLRELRRRLDEALPDVASHLEPADREQMRSDLERQRLARDAAERLGGEFDRGHEGVPLSEDAARELNEVAESMQRANRALEGGDPLESARHQEDAARRLTELRERLENEQQSGGQGGEGGSSEPDFRRPVDIPDADQFEGPMEMRRRLLDAMREAPPEGYEDAVRRYYEGLLR